MQQLEALAAQPALGASQDVSVMELQQVCSGVLPSISVIDSFLCLESDLAGLACAPLYNFKCKFKVMTVLALSLSLFHVRKQDVIFL